MRFLEIAGEPVRTRRDNADQQGRRPHYSVKGVTRDAVEEPINRLFHDLMTALESSMMNVTPAAEQRRR
jgi:hypothetical protein